MSFVLRTALPLCAQVRRSAHRAVIGFSTTASHQVASTSSSPLEESGVGRIAPRRFRQKYTVPRRIALPPASDPLLSYFTSLIMKDGKRHQAARRLAEALNNIHVLTRSPPLPILREAVERASPEVKVVSQRQRNKNVMTPRPLTAKQRTGQAIRWIIQFSERRQEHKFEQRLAREVVAIANDASDVLKKKDEMHKLALANRCVCPSIDDW